MKGKDERGDICCRRSAPWEYCHVCLILSGSCPITVTVALGDSLSLNKDGSVCRCIWKRDVRPINGQPHKWVPSVSMMESEKPCVGRDRRMAAINRTGQVKSPLIPRGSISPITTYVLAVLLWSSSSLFGSCFLQTLTWHFFIFYKDLC